MKTLHAAALALMLAACQAAPAPVGGDLYYGFTLIDPATGTRTENAWLVVENGRIAQMGSGPAPAADPARRHDLAGRFVLPGFIDAHAHITSTGLHDIRVEDGALSITMEADDRISRFNALIALARGVTTVRNPGGDPEANARYDRAIASGAWIGPEALHAGAVIQPPPFGGGSFAYPRTPQEWDAEAKREADLGMTYLKLYVGLSEDELAEGVRAAKAHGLIPIAHLDSVSWQRAADLGVEQLEHALPTSPGLLEPEARAAYLAHTGQDSTFIYRWFQAADFDGPLIHELVATLARKKIAVDLTLIVNEILYSVDVADRTPLLYDADDPSSVMPAMELADLESLYTPEQIATFTAQLKRSATGWTPDDFRRARATMPKVLAFAKLLHDAGVPMMIGTDASGGRHYARELVLHRRAGIPAWDVLRMATSDAAGIMGMGDRTGHIAPGYEADLVILDADPLADIAAAGEVHAVINNGVLLLAADLRAMKPD
jgi:imidazolonepropionase-like amidohydrolase